MAGKSSYLQYLPPVLWEDEAEGDAFSLGTVLRIFEKILTGIDDDVAVRRDGRDVLPVKDRIDRLHRLFDPWTTDERFLPWIASWVALEFPTLRDQHLWDAYQRRKVTSEIARIHRARGLKAGLSAQLDLFSVGPIRPRVAVDDGSRLLVTTPRAQGGLAPVTALVTRGPVLREQGQPAIPGLVRPSCLAVGPGGAMFLGDAGVPSDATPPVPLPSRIWRVSPNGEPDFTGTPPTPTPLPITLDQQVAAVAVRPSGAGRQEALFALQRNGRMFALPAPYAGGTATQVTAPGTTVWAVALCVDRNGDLLILDRGSLPTNFPAHPAIVTVPVAGGAPSKTALRSVVEPLSLLVQPKDGSLIIGDGGVQEPTAPRDFAGTLVRVRRVAPGNWPETVLLPPPDPAATPPVVNPLVAPTGLARIDDDRLHVLDAGLKPVTPPSDPFVLAVAEPAAVYQVTLGQPPTVVRVSEPGRLVFPTGMAADGDRMVICDPGQPDVPPTVTFWPRVAPFRFDVVIHFADARMPSDPVRRKDAVQRALLDITAIVEQHKPAHTVWNLITRH